MTIRSRLGAVLNAVSGYRTLGPGEWRRLRNCAPDRWRDSPREVSFRFPNLAHPLTIRAGTSDVGELMHTVLREAYAAYLPDAGVSCIVDAGANLGDTTCWFLSRFPKARVIALEPDPATFDLLRRNCDPYGARAVLLNAALWDQDGRVVLTDRESYSGTSARAAHPGEPTDCEAISFESLIERAGVDHVDLFKCDIEGAEDRVFRNGSSWIGMVDRFYVDIHGRAALDSVRAALRGMQVRRHGELHIFSREAR